VLAGAGAVSKTTGGTVTFAGANSYTGGTAVSAGTLALTGAGSVAASSQVNVANAAATFELSGTTTGATITTLNGVANSHVTLGGQTLTVSNGSTTYAGIIQGTGGFTVAGGTQTLSGVNTYTGETLVSGGTLANQGTLASHVTNNATFDNSGTANGGLTNTATASNTGTINAGVANSGTFTQTGAAAATNGGFTNTGTVNANGGAINGAIANNAGTFNVGGVVTSDSTFGNADGATLAVGAAGNYTVGGLLTNAGTLTVANGGTLTATAGGVLNSGTITNAGTINDDLNNIGTTTNNGVYNANVASNTGTITNNATWNGDANNTGGTITNAGTWTTTAAGFANGGTLNTTGVLDATNGGFTNTGTVNAQGVIDGAIANNAGAFNVTGALAIGNTLTNAAGASLNAIGGAQTITAPGALVFTNNGTINGNLDIASAGALNFAIAAGATSQVNGAVVMTGGAGSTLTNAGTLSMVNGVTTDSVTLGGGGGTFNYVGNGGQVNVDVNLNSVPAGASPPGSADQLRLANGTPGGNTTVNFNSVTGTTASFLAKPIPVVTWANGGAVPQGTFTQGAGLSNNGLVTYSFQQFNDAGVCGGAANCYAVASKINPSVITQTSAAITSAIASIDSAFHQPASALVASAASNEPDKWSGGPWIRFDGGTSTVKSVGTAMFPGGLTESTPTKTRTTFAGFQAGVDTGVLNVGSSGWNLHLGITAGEVVADALEKLGSGNKVHFDVPFVGLYGVATHGTFFTDFMLRHDFYSLKVTNPVAGQNHTGLSGDSTNFNASAGQHIAIGSQFFVEPSFSFSYTRSTFGFLPIFGTGTGSGIKLEPIYSLLGRAGVRVGMAPIMVSDRLAITPFATASLWHEFAGTADSVFSLADNAGGFTTVPVASSRVDTFTQLGVGFSWQVLQTGLVGFVRGDARFGDNLDGFGGVAGARYTF
jgi:hypothetical protein